MVKKFEEIDHTADAGLRIYGKNREELFRHAAEGLFHIIGSGSILSDFERPEVTKNIEIHSSDIATLLKDWLSELLYLHSTNHCYFNRFSVQSITDSALTATAEGFFISADQEDNIQDVKAVTYHGLKVTQTNEGFEAQVIFDI